MTAYYNEIDPYAAQWLRNLIAAGHIAPGDVDERSIRDVRPADLRGYTQCHFFAGIGVWSYALRLARVPDDYPVWTGSCPCQPFSAAGKRQGTSDDRHLWPEFFRLIDACRPSIVMGEQVASKDGLAWLDIVYADLEGARYAVRAGDTCAAGFGAPHIRQRLYWCGEAFGGVAHTLPAGRPEGRPESGRGSPASSSLGKLGDDDDDARLERRSLSGTDRSGHSGSERAVGETGAVDGSGRLEHASGERRERRETPASGHVHDGAAPGRAQGQHGAGVASPYRRGPVSAVDGMGDPVTACAARFRKHGRASTGPDFVPEHCGPSRRNPTNGFWHPADWLPCRDRKARPVEPGTFPLAHGAPARVGRLRAYGNAIVAPQAAAFIEAIRAELL